MTVDELKEALRLHALWRNDLPGGARLMLDGVSFKGAKLQNLNFSGVELFDVDFTNTYLQGSNFSNSMLERCNFTYADLLNANFYEARIHATNFEKAYLRNANFNRSLISTSNFSKADCRGTTFRGSKMRDMKSEDVDFGNYSIVPEEGYFIAYKKVYTNTEELVAKLEIPDFAKRVSTPLGRKCRADKATVLKFLTLDRKPALDVKWAYSGHDTSFKYHLNALVEADYYDGDITKECTGGIHFFMTFKEAAEY